MQGLEVDGGHPFLFPWASASVSFSVGAVSRCTSRFCILGGVITKAIKQSRDAVYSAIKGRMAQSFVLNSTGSFRLVSAVVWLLLRIGVGDHEARTHRSMAAAGSRCRGASVTNRLHCSSSRHGKYLQFPAVIHPCCSDPKEALIDRSMIHGHGRGEIRVKTPCRSPRAN